MAKISGVSFSGLDVFSEEEAGIVRQRVTNLLTHRELMLPGNRGFGMNDTYVDDNPDDMQNSFAMDLYEKMETFIPDIDVSEIRWDEAEGLNGTYRPTLVLDRKEG